MIEKLLYYKKINMSIPEFLAYERGEITLKEIWGRRELDKFFGKIMDNKKYKCFLVFILASALIVINSINTYAVDTTAIDNVGNTLLGLFKTCGYWFCIILGLKEIIGVLLSGDYKKIGSIFVTYSLAFGSFYALPWVFDMIKDLLK